MDALLAGNDVMSAKLTEYSLHQTDNHLILEVSKLSGSVRVMLVLLILVSGLADPGGCGIRVPVL